MYVHQCVTVSAQQRAKARAHTGGVEDDRAPFFQRRFETPVQFVKDTLAAAALIMRQIEPYRIGAEQQGTVIGR